MITVTFIGGDPTAVGGNFLNANESGQAQTGLVTLIATSSDGTILTFSLDPSIGTFAGITTTGGEFITSLTIQSQNFPTMLDLTVGSAIPEPGTFGLLGGALLAFGVLSKSLRIREC